MLKADLTKMKVVVPKHKTTGAETDPTPEGEAGINLGTKTGILIVTTQRG
jgi:hypothetical protein